MTPGEALKKLEARKKRHAKKRGPSPLTFTLTEIEACRVLSAHGHTQATLASRSGLSLSGFKNARERDPKLNDAMLIGRAEERLRITEALLKTALDSKNPRQVQAAVTLMKARHGYKDGGAGGGVDVDVTVNNKLVMPGPIDARKYKRLISDRDKLTHTPAVIEHDAPTNAERAEPTIGDIISAVRRSQKENADD